MKPSSAPPKNNSHKDIKNQKSIDSGSKTISPSDQNSSPTFEDIFPVELLDKELFPHFDGLTATLFSFTNKNYYNKYPSLLKKRLRTEKLVVAAYADGFPQLASEVLNSFFLMVEPKWILDEFFITKFGNNKFFIYLFNAMGRLNRLVDGAVVTQDFVEKTIAASTTSEKFFEVVTKQLKFEKFYGNDALIISDVPKIAQLATHVDIDPTALAWLEKRADAKKGNQEGFDLALTAALSGNHVDLFSEILNKTDRIPGRLFDLSYASVETAVKITPLLTAKGFKTIGSIELLYEALKGDDSNVFEILRPLFDYDIWYGFQVDSAKTFQESLKLVRAYYEPDFYAPRDERPPVFTLRNLDLLRQAKNEKSFLPSWLNKFTYASVTSDIVDAVFAIDAGVYPKVLTDLHNSRNYEVHSHIFKYIKGNKKLDIFSNPSTVSDTFAPILKAVLEADNFGLFNLYLRELPALNKPEIIKEVITRTCLRVTHIKFLVNKLEGLKYHCNSAMILKELEVAARRLNANVEDLKKAFPIFSQQKKH